MSSPGDKIADLQVMRGIAILTVLFYHFSLPGALLDLFPGRISHPGYMGVELFFVISGYVITQSVMKTDYNGPRFFLRRIFRLTPAVVSMSVLVFALSALAAAGNLSDDGRRLFVVPVPDVVRQSVATMFGFYTLLTGTKSYYFGAMWSLTVEDQFYAAMTVLLTIGVFVLRRNANLVRSLVGVVAVSLLVVAWGLRLALLSGWDVERHVPAFLTYILAWKFDMLPVGVLLALVEPWLNRRLLARAREVGTFVAPLLLASALALISVCEKPEASLADSPFLSGFGYPVAAFLFFWFVWLGANNLAFPSSRGLVHRFMLYLGDRSYTLYLFHFPVFALAWMIMTWVMPFAMATPIRYGIAQIVLATPLLVLFTELNYKRVELPLTAFGRRVSQSFPALNVFSAARPSVPGAEARSPAGQAASIGSGAPAA